MYVSSINLYFFQALVLINTYVNFTYMLFAICSLILATLYLKKYKLFNIFLIFWVLISAVNYLPDREDFDASMLLCYLGIFSVLVTLTSGFFVQKSKRSLV